MRVCILLGKSVAVLLVNIGGYVEKIPHYSHKYALRAGGILKKRNFPPEQKEKPNQNGMTPAKTWLIAAGALVAAYVVYRGSSLVKGIDIRITQFGNPTIQAGVISAPVQLAINNKNIFPIPVDNTIAEIFIQQPNTPGGWLKVGSTTPTGPFTIRSGQSSLVLQPNILIKSFGTNIFTALNNLLSIKPVLKVVSITTIQGKTFVTEKLAALA